MFRNVKFITLESNISGGKTTLLKKLAKDLEGKKDIYIDHEPVEQFQHYISHDKEKFNPLMEFYKDKQKNMVAFQHYVLDLYDSRYSYLKKVHANKKLIILDRGLDSCAVFINTSKNEYSSFSRASLIDKYQSIKKKHFAGPIATDYLVWLPVNSELAMNRISSRNRMGENLITKTYIECLEKSYQDYLVQVKKANVPIIVLQQENALHELKAFILHLLKNNE